MDVADDVRACQAQQLVIALDVFGEILEALAPVLGLIESEALDHGAHSTIKHHDAAVQNARQRLASGIGVCCHGGDCRKPVLQAEIGQHP